MNKQQRRPSTTGSSSRTPPLWLVHSGRPHPSKPIPVMTMETMGTTENLHNSHFFNVSVAKTSAKHKYLIQNAKATVNCSLHPFVKVSDCDVSERSGGSQLNQFIVRSAPAPASLRFASLRFASLEERESPLEGKTAPERYRQIDQRNEPPQHT